MPKGNPPGYSRQMQLSPYLSGLNPGEALEMAVRVDWLSPTLSSLHFLRSPSAGVKCVNAMVRGTTVVAVTCGGVGAGFTLSKYHVYMSH